MNKLFLMTMITSSLVFMGCTHNQVSEGIAKDGSSAQKIIFPTQKSAWIKEGTFPNLENLAKIDKGVTKEDLYHLLGVPHFSEAQHADEWDYLFKFRDAKTRAVHICQYKVLFDTTEKAQSFYWLPTDCATYAQPKEPQIIVKEAAPIIMPRVKKERITLGADALFAFNKHMLKDMLPAGRIKLDKLARRLLDIQKDNDTRLMVIGHTDRLGDDMYNLNLSQLRSQTVRAYLISRGVEAATISASGAGETTPVKMCYEGMERTNLIQCLQPNRRVTIDVAYY